MSVMRPIKIQLQAKSTPRGNKGKKKKKKKRGGKCWERGRGEGREREGMKRDGGRWGKRRS